jgi:uncharacterized protein YbjT (DUF2867 family)
MSHTYLVVGASGSVGSQVVRNLAAQGHAVVALTSRPEQAGRTEGSVRWVQANVKTGEGLAAAFEGVTRALVFAPPGYVPQNDVISPLIKLAQKNKLDKVVLMTALGANADENAPLRLAERELEASGLTWNIVRPNWFMQNFHTFWLHGILNQGQILLPTGQAKGSFIDVRDIADVVARLLTSHDLDNQAFDITGAESLNHDEVAAILSRVTGRAIGYQNIPPQALKDGMVAAGASADYADFLLLILSFFAQGYSAHTTTAVHDLLGRQPRMFEQYAQEHRQAFMPA